MTDYTMGDKPMEILTRRTLVYLCLIGGIALIAVGLWALFNTIDTDMITLAQNSLRELQAAH
jgi:hypothetical protein